MKKKRLGLNKSENAECGKMRQKEEKEEKEREVCRPEIAHSQKSGRLITATLACPYSFAVAGWGIVSFAVVRVGPPWPLVVVLARPVVRPWSVSVWEQCWAVCLLPFVWVVV